MLVNTNIAFAVRCDVCGGLQLHNTSLFELYKDKKTELKCTCGQINAIIKAKDFKSFWIDVVCFACQERHIFKYTLKQLLKGNIVTRCIETGMEICFIGNNEDIHELIEKNEKNPSELLSELGFYDYFENFEVIMKSLEFIKQLDNDGRIKCDCGSYDILTDLFPDRIELKCLNCDSIKMIYAENDEDYRNLKKRERILMHKHGFECIDAINQTNDYFKK